MPRMVWTKSIFGGSIYVQEGTIFTRDAWEQWNGWPGKGGRHRPGLKEQYRAQIEELEWAIGRIEQMIEAGLTHEHNSSTKRVISDYEEEYFYEDLEDLRDSPNETLAKANARRAGIELAQAMIDHPRTEPEQRDAALNRIEVLKKRLEEDVS